jgi:hypothetical protein
VSETTQVIIPDADIRGGRRKGRSYIDSADLVAWLYKAAGEPGQDGAVALAFRMMAEMIEESDLR